MESGNSVRRKWDQSCECVYGASSSCLSAQPCPQLPELPRSLWRDNDSFYFPDFLQPAETGAGLHSAWKSEDLEAVPGNPGRCVSWLAHTAWMGADLFHSEFLPSIPKGMNSDLQVIGTGGESSIQCCQPALHSLYSPSASSADLW